MPQFMKIGKMYNRFIQDLSVIGWQKISLAQRGYSAAGSPPFAS